MSGRNNQVARLYTVYSLLESSRLGMTVQQIHSAVRDRGHDVSWRTIYRDIGALRKAGFPLLHLSNTSEEDPASMWKLETSKQPRTIAATPRELLALYFSQEVFAHPNHPFSADLKTLIGKFTARMGTAHLKHLEELRQSTFVRSALDCGPEVDAAILETFQSACAEGHWIEGDYTPSGKPLSTRKLAPQFVLLAKEGLYLIAVDESGVAKTYSVARFSRAEMLEEAYTGRKRTPEEYLGSTMGLFSGSEKPELIELRFRYPYAQYIQERKWHPSQSIEKVGEECRLRLELSITNDLVRWVLQFGGDVEVIGPEHFRERIASELEKACGRYRAPRDKKAA